MKEKTKLRVSKNSPARNRFTKDWDRADSETNKKRKTGQTENLAECWLDPSEDPDVVLHEMPVLGVDRIRNGSRQGD